MLKEQRVSENPPALMAVQMKRIIDLLQADLDSIQVTADHRQELIEHRLRALEELARDHETRIRSTTDGVVQFKVWSGLAAGGSGIFSLMALIKAFTGG
jgi:hypothetical protein